MDCVELPRQYKALKVDESTDRQEGFDRRRSWYIGVRLARGPEIILIEPVAGVKAEQGKTTLHGAAQDIDAPVPFECLDKGFRSFHFFLSSFFAGAFEVGVDFLFYLFFSIISQEMNSDHILQEAGADRTLGATDLMFVQNLANQGMDFDYILYILTANIIKKFHQLFSFIEDLHPIYRRNVAETMTYVKRGSFYKKSGEVVKLKMVNRPPSFLKIMAMNWIYFFGDRCLL
jgi:hypothetical protein